MSASIPGLYSLDTGITYLEAKSSIQSGLYIGRKDRRISKKYEGQSAWQLSINAYLFDSNDIGKKVKTWVGFTPFGTTTDLKLVSSNCHLYREVA